MKLSRHSECAFRTLVFLALEPDQKFRIEDIAKAHNIPRNHLVKVVAHLVKRGYVTTHRGRYGGVSLGKAADSILMGDLIREMDHLNQNKDGCSGCLMRPLHNCIADMGGNTIVVAGAVSRGEQPFDVYQCRR